MRKVIFIGIFILCMFITPRFASASSETLGDLRQDYESKLALQQANESAITETKEAIAEKNAAIAQANKNITQAKEDTEQAELDIYNSNVKIEELTANSKTVLLYLQQVQGSNSYLEYVTGATSMTELVARIEAVKQVTSYIQSTIGDLETEIANNEQLKIDLAAKQKAEEESIATNTAIIAQYEDNLDTYDAYNQSIGDQVKAAKSLYETTKQTCINNLGSANVSDSTLISDCSKVPVNSGWLKPLTKGRVSSLVGKRSISVGSSNHNALDLAGNPEGTPVYAAAAGEVVATYYHQSCGGNEVFIYSNVDGTYYTHFYYHLLKYTVSIGDIVDQNTVIGYVGGGSSTYWDSCSTGAHLHFGIAKGKVTSHTTNVLTSLPGFGNYIGYSWTSRYDYYS